MRTVETNPRNMGRGRRKPNARTRITYKQKTETRRLRLRLLMYTRNENHSKKPVTSTTNGMFRFVTDFSVDRSVAPIACERERTRSRRASTSFQGRWRISSRGREKLRREDERTGTEKQRRKTTKSDGKSNPRGRPWKENYINRGYTRSAADESNSTTADTSTQTRRG